MKFLFSIKGLKAFSIAALAGVCTVPVWAANNPASSDAVVSKVEVEPVERLDAEALETLVAPVALYPDDLLAVVLPASTYPLQIVLAARFLEAGSDNADGDAVEPNEEWDDAVVALLNYPEVVALMDGNLKSDGKQEVAVNDAGAIEIKPAVPDEIYVPYYEPAQVVVRQPVRVYHYHPRPYPVYYYPYHQGYDFAYGPFWGVTSVFSIGWHTRNLHLHHYGFQDHPYYSYRYYDPFYHRRPHLVLNIYDRDRRHRHRHRSERHHRGNDWRSERSKRNHRQWADRGHGRRSEGHRGDRRRWAGRDNGPRGEGRRANRHLGERQRRTQPGEGQSIAHRLANGAAPVIHRPTRIAPLDEARPRPNASGAAAGAATVNRTPAGATPITHQPTRVTSLGEAPARPQPSRSAEVSRGTRINRAPPPKAQRRHADNRQLHQPTRRQAIGEARARPNLNPGALPRMQRSAPATRQAAPQAHSEPRINRQASPRVDRAAKPARPAPQRPVRTRSGSSNDDFSPRQPH